jgi:hypothetical protein
MYCSSHIQTHSNKKAVSSITTGIHFNVQMKPGLREGWRIVPWQDNFKHLMISMYK